MAVNALTREQDDICVLPITMSMISSRPDKSLDEISILTSGKNHAVGSAPPRFTNLPVVKLEDVVYLQRKKGENLGRLYLQTNPTSVYITSPNTHLPQFTLAPAPRAST